MPSPNWLHSPAMPTKRRQKGTGTVFQRGDGYWLGAVNIVDGNGKRRRKTVSGKTEATVKRRLAALVKQLDQTGTLPMGQQTLKVWTDYWLTHIAAPRVRPRTLTSYQSHVTRYIVPAIGRVKLEKVTPQHVRAVTDYVLEKRLSSTTAQHAQVTLTNLLGDAHREGLIPRNPAAVVRAPSRAPSKRGALTAAQGIDLLLSAEKAQDPMLSRWAMALLTGQRQGECLGLEIERVHADRLDISWQLQALPFEHGCGRKVSDEWPCGSKRGGNCPHRRHVFQPGFEYRETNAPRLFLTKPKTHERVIPLVEPFRSSLLRTINGRTEGLVWQKDGRPIDPKDDWQAWKDALRLAKLPDVTLHEARHTTATLLLEAGVDVKVIGQMLGQSSVLVTAGYQHVSLALATEAANRLSRALTR